MIRYLAFNDQLPIVAGLTRRKGATVEIRLRGHWVRGDRWTPPSPTPASPGYPSADAAFAYAASTVLGPPAASRARAAAALGLSGGTELPADVAAGRAIGISVGKLARAKR
jgi:hypothetical protein